LRNDFVLGFCAEYQENLRSNLSAAFAEHLTMFDPISTSIQPLRKLGVHGSSLWNVIMSEYHLEDGGGLEILMQACEAADRVAALAEKISIDGAVIQTKNGPKAHPALKDELAGRAFICRTLERLGLNLEAIRPIGRPSGVAWKGREEDRKDGDADN
jgi:hypothetical protein